MQYKIPQDVQKEDKIIGPFSLRQFLYLLGGAGVGYIIFSIVSKIAGSASFGFIAGFIFFVSISAFAVIEIQGKPLPEFVIAFTIFNLRPRKRVWQKDIFIPDIAYIPTKKKERKAPPPKDPSEIKSELDKLAHVLDTRGWGELAKQKEQEEIYTMYEKAEKKAEASVGLKEKELKKIKRAEIEKPPAAEGKPEKKIPYKPKLEKTEPEIVEVGPEEKKIKPKEAPKEKAETKRITRLADKIDTKKTLPTPLEKPKKEQPPKEITPKARMIEPKEETEPEPPTIKKVEETKPKPKKEKTKTILKGALREAEEKAQKKTIKKTGIEILKEEADRELKRQIIIQKELARVQAELKSKIKKDLKKQKAERKKSLLKLKSAVSDIEKIAKSPEERKTKKRTKKTVPPVISAPLPVGQKKEEEVIVEKYNIDLESRITTPRTVKPTMNIKIDEKELEDILENTEKVKNLKGELENIEEATYKQIHKKKPKLIKGPSIYNE